MWPGRILLVLSCLSLAGAAGSVIARDAGDAPDATRISGMATPQLTHQAEPGVLLVARRELTGSGFAHSVVLLLRHDARGSLGVVVNRRTRFHLHDLMPEFDREQAAQHRVHVGGPVAPHTLVLVMRGEAPATGIDRVTETITFSAERDVLEALIERQKSAKDLRLFLGYAGWAPGQLDAELVRHAWFLVRSDDHAVFGEQDDLWERYINKLDPPGIRVWFEQAPQTVVPLVAASLAARQPDRP